MFKVETGILVRKDHNQWAMHLALILKAVYIVKFRKVPLRALLILLLFTWLHLGSILKQAGMNTIRVTVAEMKMFECQDQLIAHLLSQ